MALKIFNNKKGTWAWADFLYFFFYVGLTFVLAIALGAIPDSILNSVLQKGNLEYTTNNDRMNTMLAYKDPYSGRFVYDKIESENIISVDVARNLLVFPENKKIAIALSLDGKTFYYKKDFYEIAKPLTPITYESVINTRLVQLPNKEWRKLTIEQVYKPT
ncbi:hypothetical protein KY310_01145 [Candidatus Woesearchaeota archaeon]|nr:hypothetical protein [Candidatus Woesearchaeota archaeon]